MKEQETPYDLKNLGLRKDYRNPHNEPGLIDCMNAKPTEWGLLGLEPITNPLAESMIAEGIDIIWPYPQLHIGKTRSWLIANVGGAGHIYRVNADWTLTATIPDISSAIDGPWSIVDYFDYSILTTPNSMWYYDDATSMWVAAPWMPADTGCNSACDYKGRLILGLDIGLQWSDIGSTSLVPDRKNEAGYRPMPWRGSVYVVRRLGDFVVAYGSGGITAYKAVSSPAPTLAMVELENNVGIAAGRAVAGGLNGHWYVDEAGELWSLTPDLKRTKLGYQEFFYPMLGSVIVGSYDPQKFEAYFSNGEISYVLTPQGLGMTNQHIACLTVTQGGPIGIYTLGDRHEYRITPDTLDFKNRSGKTLMVVEVEGEMPNESYCTTYWRRNRKEFFREANDKRLNNEGVAYPIVSGTDLRVSIHSEYPKCMSLSHLNFRWKATDKRSVRGRRNVN